MQVRNDQRHSRAGMARERREQKTPLSQGALRRHGKALNHQCERREATQAPHQVAPGLLHLRKACALRAG